MLFEYQSNFNAIDGSKVSHLLKVRAERADPTPPTHTHTYGELIDGKQFNSYAKCLQAPSKISLYHTTFTFYDSPKVSLYDNSSLIQG